MRTIRTLISAVVALLMLGGVVHGNTLKWAAARDVLTLDPNSSGQLAFLNHIYEGLVRYNKELGIEPALAESWEMVEPTVWRFNLRKGVVFHNGESFTADDVIASLKRITNELSPLKGNLASFKEARKIDDHTVEISLNRINPLFLNDLTSVFIFSHKWLTENNAEIPADLAKSTESYASRHTNGTGPFILDAYQPDVKSVLVANPNWWDKPQHNLERIEFTPIASASTRVAALLSGEINFTESAPLQDLGRLKADGDITVFTSPELRTVFFLFNMREKPFEADAAAQNPLRDIRVRKALYQAIAIDQVQTRAMRGLSRNSGSLVAPVIPGYSEELDARPPFDPEQAKALLAEAGYPEGFPLTLVCSTDFYVNEQEICQSAASMWARIGIKVNLSSGPRSVQYAKQVKGEFDVAPLGWSNEPTIDAYSILSQVVHSKTQSLGVYNWGGWSVPEIDGFIDKSASELDQEKRVALMNSALKAANDEVLFLPLHQQPMAWAARADVAEVVQLPDNRARHWYTKMK